MGEVNWSGWSGLLDEVGGKKGFAVTATYTVVTAYVAHALAVTCETTPVIEYATHASTLTYAAAPVI